MNAPDRFELFVLPEGAKKQLVGDSDVKFAGYRMPHPLDHNIVIRIQTYPHSTPIQALEGSIHCLIDEFSKLELQFIERDNFIKITLFRNLPSKRQREQFIPIAYSETNLSQILQQGDFIADLDMTPFQPPKSMLDNLVPISLNVTICSVPKEFDNIGDAQEYQLNDIALSDDEKRRGRRILSAIEKMPATCALRTRYTIVPTRTTNDVTLVFKTVVARYQNNRAESMLRVVVAGSDSYINAILRPYVSLLSAKPRGWDPFVFYLLPIGKSNDVASVIGAMDAAYQTLFLAPTSDWRRLLDGDGPIDTDMANELAIKILSYVDKTNTRFSHKFPIGEALLTFPTTTSMAIPFLKGLLIPNEIEGSSVEQDLKIDYWVPKKKGDDHLELKTPFQFARLTRPQPPSSSSSSLAPVTREGKSTDPLPPPSSTFSLFVLYKDKSRDKQSSKKYLPKFGKQRSKTGPGTTVVSGGGGSSEKKEERLEKKEEKDSGKDKTGFTSLITKLMCGPPPSSSSSSSSNATENPLFHVNIDGVDVAGVKFLSVQL
eukprot:gene7382-8603_t